jgi:hypothetical protein
MNQQNLDTDLSDIIPLGISIKSGKRLSQSLRCSRFRIYSEQDDVCNAEALVYFCEINRMRVEEKIEPTEYSTFHQTQSQDPQSQVWQIDSFLGNSPPHPPGLIFRLTRIN